MKCVCAYVGLLKIRYSPLELEGHDSRVVCAWRAFWVCLLKARFELLGLGRHDRDVLSMLSMHEFSNTLHEFSSKYVRVVGLYAYTNTHVHGRGSWLGKLILTSNIIKWYKKSPLLLLVLRGSLPYISTRCSVCVYTHSHTNIHAYIHIYIYKKSPLLLLVLRGSLP